MSLPLPQNLDQVNDEELAFAKLLRSEIDRINQSSQVETTQEVLPGGHEHQDLTNFLHSGQHSGDHAMNETLGLDVFPDLQPQVTQPLTPPPDFDQFNDEELAKAKLFLSEVEELTQSWASQGPTHFQQQRLDNIQISNVHEYRMRKTRETSNGDILQQCRSPAEVANYWNKRHIDSNTARPTPIKYKSPEQRAAARLEKKASDELRKAKKAAARAMQKAEAGWE